MSMDSNERAQLEQKLRESEERFELIADTAPVLMWMSGTDKLCTYFNRPWLEFTGRSLEQELGNGWADGVHPEDFDRCLETYAQAFDGREKFRMEYRLRRYDGEYRWILDMGVPRFNPDGSFAGYIGISVDVNERKVAEDKLREYEKAVEGLEEMIVVVDREYRYRLANRKFLNMRNMTKEQVLGRLAHEVLNPGVFEGVIKEKLDECFQGRVVRYEMKYTYPGLGERDVLASYFPIEGDSGIDRVACIVQDITERKRAEEALSGISRKLIEAQEQERARIARELHDDIGQRLALLAVNLCRVQQDAQALPAEATGRVRELQKQAAEISTNVHALSHALHGPKLDSVGIATAMRSICNDFSEHQRVKIDFKSQDLPAPVRVETSLCLVRVLQEALQNVAKHSGVQHAAVQLQGTTEEIHLTVSDLGRGFDLDGARHGRGLGLTNMQERVRVVNGTILIQSKPKGGTTIHVRVPARSAQAAQQAAG